MFDAQNVNGTSFVLPDDPGPPLSVVESAESRLYLAGYTLTPERVTRTLASAARRGVDVRVLVDGGPVGGMPATQAVRLETLASVGVAVRVLDGERALVGSLNWNEHAATENREVVVVVEDEKLAGYYQRVFRADWRGGAWRLPVGLAGVVAVSALSGVVCANRIEFRGG